MASFTLVGGTSNVLMVTFRVYDDDRISPAKEQSNRRIRTHIDAGLEKLHFVTNQTPLSLAVPLPFQSGFWYRFGVDFRAFPI